MIFRIRSCTGCFTNERVFVRRVLTLAIFFVFLISGCSFAPANGFGGHITSDENTASGSDSELLSVKDSVSRFDIYPEYRGYAQIGGFDRVQFSNLTELQQSIYIKLDNAVYGMQTGYIDVGSCSYRDLELAYYALRCDRPEYFWLPMSYYLKVYGSRREICFAEDDSGWLCTAKERAETEKAIKAILDGFCSEIGGNLPEYDRELKAHDWLAGRITYDYEAVGNIKTVNSAWTIEGAFINGLAVCEGYSKAMQVMCYMLGINCGVVTGTTSGAHMWNYVNIDGKWYHLDLTADDGEDKGYHSYFNVTSAYLEKSRYFDPDASEVSDDVLEEKGYNYRLPVCSSTENNYYVRNSVYVTNLSQYKSTVVSVVCDAVRSGKRSVEIGFAPNIGFVFGRSSVKDFGDLGEFISAANAELPENMRIKRYTYSGLNGAMGMMISW